MSGLVGYVWRDTIRSYRWAAPLLVFLGVEAVLSGTTGSVMPTYGGVAVTILFIAIWFAVVVSNNEDPIQSRVTAVTAGSVSKVRLAKLLVAFLATAVLGILGLVAPAVLAPAVTSADLAEGALGVLTTAMAGVAIGAMCTRPIIKRRLWALLCGVIGGLVTVLIPHCPPTRQLLVLFGGNSTNLTSGLLIETLETVVLGALIVAVSLNVAWRRS